MNWIEDLWNVIEDSSSDLMIGDERKKKSDWRWKFKNDSSIEYLKVMFEDEWLN